MGIHELLLITWSFIWVISFYRPWIRPITFSQIPLLGLLKPTCLTFLLFRAKACPFCFTLVYLWYTVSLYFIQTIDPSTQELNYITLLEDVLSLYWVCFCFVLFFIPPYNIIKEFLQIYCEVMCNILWKRDGSLFSIKSIDLWFGLLI